MPTHRKHVHFSLSGLRLCALLTSGVVLIDWLRRRKQGLWAPLPLHSPTFQSGVIDGPLTVPDLSCDWDSLLFCTVTSLTWLHSSTTVFFFFSFLLKTDSSWTVGGNIPPSSRMCLSEKAGLKSHIQAGASVWATLCHRAGTQEWRGCG